MNSYGLRWRLFQLLAKAGTYRFCTSTLKALMCFAANLQADTANTDLSGTQVYLLRGLGSYFWDGGGRKREPFLVGIPISYSRRPSKLGRLF